MICNSQNRTRAQLFLHMIEEITQTMDDVDYPSLTKGMVCKVYSVNPFCTGIHNLYNITETS